MNMVSRIACFVSEIGSMNSNIHIANFSKLDWIAD